MPVTLGLDFIRRTLAGWGLLGHGPRRGLLDDVLQVTTELLANACVYGRGIRELVLEHRLGVLRVEVSDHSPAPPHRRTPTFGYPGGYGLLVVERLATCWGTTADTAGKRVWAELLTTHPRWC
ncbi:ATP-binding protein [Kitasatospora sp. NPDC101157]|uniref:ATP-binding protein n=1 Tax=Kitasatospora sp. NPDC101157 TaxID=3364098 RepID=UPI003804CD0F